MILLLLMMLLSWSSSHTDLSSYSPYDSIMTVIIVYIASTQSSLSLYLSILESLLNSVFHCFFFDHPLVSLILQLLSCDRGWCPKIMHHSILNLILSLLHSKHRGKLEVRDWWIHTWWDLLSLGIIRDSYRIRMTGCSWIDTLILGT